MSRELSDLTADTREAANKLIARAKELGLSVRVDSTLRSCAEQAALYAQGRTEGGSVVTQVKGCGSYHVIGRAVDIFVGSWDCADYLALGEFWEALGGRWGGRFSFKDCVHFEWPHPTAGMDVLCPPDLSCEEALSRQPPAITGTTLAVLGAAVGGALAIALTGGAARLPRRRRA